MTLSARNRLSVADDSGVALVTVLGYSLVAMLLVSAAVGYAVNTMPQTRDHEAWNAALAAAEAGVDDLKQRLNGNPMYWSSADPADNPALEGWRDMPGGPSGAQYHYRIDSSQVGRQGNIDVVSTGRVGDQMRTVQVRLRRDGFLDNIYFTDFDTSDPYHLTTNQSIRDELDTLCAQYHPQRPRQSHTANPRGCGEIRFGPFDVLEGPTRSNDALMIGPGSDPDDPTPRFLGPVQTGWDGLDEDGDFTGRLYIPDPADPPGEPFFRDGITTVQRLPLPQTTTDLRDAAATTGCLYEGPTYIRFLADPPRMTVVSPLTDPSSVDPACGTATSGAPTGGINSTVPLVDGEVLYARDSTADNDEHPLGLSNPYGIRAGDIFVHGVLNGSVTVAAENDVVVVHNLRYHEFSQDSSDLLGLISGNNVTVFRPSGTWLGRDRPPFNHAHTTINEVPANATVWTNARIDAAILALNRSFGVQRYSVTPSLGDLTVNGAIAQKFRGPVATGSFNPSTGELSINSGYEKDYFYDERLRFLSPPYFLTPAEAPWGRRLWAELSRPPFCADGVNPQTADPVCIPQIE